MMKWYGKQKLRRKDRFRNQKAFFIFFSFNSSNMRNKIVVPVYFLLALSTASAQQQPERTKLRIVDTLSKQEKTNRNPVILKAELDSMIQLHMASLPVVPQKEPIKEIVTKIPSWISVAGIAALVIIAVLLYLLFGYHKRLTKTVSDLKRLIQNFEFYVASAAGMNAKEPAPRGKTAMEKKINDLNEELEKQKKSNQLLQQEYESNKEAF